MTAERIEEALAWADNTTHVNWMEARVLAAALREAQAENVQLRDALYAVRQRFDSYTASDVRDGYARCAAEMYAAAGEAKR